MNEAPNLTDYRNIAKSVAQTNIDILEQNNRVELTYTIEDDDFKKLAIDGIYSEQEASVTRRSELATAIDYGQLGKDMNLLEDTVQQQLDAVVSLSSVAEKIRAQAELAKAAAPRQSEAIDAMSESKIAANDEIMSASQSALAFSRNQQQTYQLIGKQWTIPALYKIETTAETAEDVIKIVNSVESDPITVDDAAECIGSVATKEAVTFPAKELVEQAVTSAEDVETIINSVFWAVCDYAMKHSKDGVRVEEMRRAVPELSQLSDAEYKVFKNKFAGIRMLIEERLNEYGTPGSWETTGQTRGTRYHLHMKDADSPHERPTFFNETPQANKAPINPDTSNTTQLIADEKLSEELNLPEPEESNPADLPLVKAMLQAISDAQLARANSPLRRTVIVRNVSESLGINEIDAGAFVSNLLSLNLLHSHGQLKGSEVFSVEPLSQDFETQVTVPKTNTVEQSAHDTDLNDDSLVEELTEDDIELKPAERDLMIIKSTMDGGKFGGVTQPLTISQIAKQFGLKRNHELAREAERAVRWLQQNPLTAASRRIKAFKGATVDGQVLPLRRFSPRDCPELTTRNVFDQHRIVYAVTDTSVVIFDVINHDAFDIKYK